MSFLTIQSFDERFDFLDLDRIVERTCRVALEHPEALYLFMQRYTYFNSYAGSWVARLASSIGLSRELFVDRGCEVYDEADRGLKVAARVFAAAIDEHGDRHMKGLPHRVLAQATLKAIGNYGRLSNERRNMFAAIPSWLAMIVTETGHGYQGAPGNLRELIFSMGFHAASELLADREYTTIDRIIRHEHRDSGFALYLRTAQGTVEIDGGSVSSWYWIAVHGQHGNSGVEKDHFDDAAAALNLAVQYRTEPAVTLQEWFFEGFGSFVDIQQRLFENICRECANLNPEATQPAVVLFA
ncbi:hypothetical protein [Gloeobacter morelensis]|uniref:Uncharacterized protein n=1 Tax=Gloeobacter morelensis MG652769 TaxID=2781736 RepID=A0ABY3PSC3_9CYAN|nr:hypothetical protein [Gloeobacter morelensis]UFP96550.1 hypothetical protein ISF26_10195 [Gloeobacter morelensis MG652769]